MATGLLTARQCLTIMMQALPKIFTRRPWPLLPKYPRQPFIDAWIKHIGQHLRMSELKTHFIATAVSVCDAHTHYFKSDDPSDRDLQVLEVVLRSFAAPAYFGGLVDQVRRTVWLDGGTGIDNCPVLEPVYEAMARDWLKEGQTYLLSLGTGRHDPSLGYDKAKQLFGKNLREVGLYTSMADGGLARLQSRRSRVEFVEKLSEEIENLWFKRIDAKIPEEMDCMDGIKYLGSYLDFGENMVEQLDYSPLIT
jgi:hypothetical protein